MSIGDKIGRIKVYFFDEIGISNFESFNAVVFFCLKNVSDIRE